MSYDHPDIGRLQELCGLLRDGDATDDTIAEMERLLVASGELRQYYADYIFLQSAMERHECAPERLDPAAERFDETDMRRSAERSHEPLPDDGPAEDRTRLPARENAAAPLTSVPPAITLIPGATPTLSPFSLGGMAFSYFVALLVVGAGLLISSFVYVPRFEPLAVQPTKAPRVAITSDHVARITGMVDCVWEDQVGGGKRSAAPPRTSRQAQQDQDVSNHQSEIIDHKSLLHLGDRLALKSGLLEITYDTGARVILQGPVTYDVESPSGGYLSVGKLTAKLEKKSEVSGQWSDSANQKSEIINHQFVVRTPTAFVTDLGTEFGVDVDSRGGTTSHVFRGSIKMQAASADAAAEGVSQVLYQNQSACVESGKDNRIRLLTPAAKPVAFLRELPKQPIQNLDLVDVVAGGDGFSNRRNRGIDPTTGRAVSRPSRARIMVGDGRYHRVERLPFIDGVFIPNSNRGSVQTDSAGHTSDAFDPMPNETWHCIWAGGGIPSNDPRRSFPTVLGGVDFSAPGHGLLYMHANKGITFDLDAIRRANPGSRIVRFRTVVGNTETPAVLASNTDGRTKTLLSEDFKAAPLGDLSSTIEWESNMPANSGAWTPAVSRTVASVVRNADSNVDGDASNKYLEVRQSHVWASGWNFHDTDNQIVQLSAAVWVPAEPGATALVDAFADHARQKRTFTVYLGADGKVKYYTGNAFVKTDLVSHPGTWQNVLITANMAAHLFSIRLDNQPLCTGCFWTGGASQVAGLLLGKDSDQGTVGFDNVELKVVAPSVFDASKPGRMAADVWVLVDGERRSGRRGCNRASGAYSMSVPLAENDRFLTLVATDGGDSLFWDSVLFGDPRLEMVPARSPQQPGVKSE